MYILAGGTAPTDWAKTASTDYSAVVYVLYCTGQSSRKPSRRHQATEACIFKSCIPFHATCCAVGVCGGSEIAGANRLEPVLEIVCSLPFEQPLWKEATVQQGVCGYCTVWDW